jgi:hypothetical protein
MKKIIFGTIAAATVIASATAASAQTRVDRNWEMSTQTMDSSWDQPARRKGVSYGYNLRFDRADVGK